MVSMTPCHDSPVVLAPGALITRAIGSRSVFLLRSARLFELVL
jgi:hypothetical protein